MNPFKKSKLAKAALLALSLTAVPLSMPVFAQDTPPAPVVAEQDDGGSWGWLGLLGLIGLAGLAGLRKKRDRGVVSHSTSR